MTFTPAPGSLRSMQVDDPALQTDRANVLTERLESLEVQLGRLTDLLSEQAVARKRRRRQLTLRLLLASFVFFGVLFAWFGHVYHQSRRQAAAVDVLVSQNAFIYYQPRDNALVSLMPGDANNPPRFLTKWFGDDFFRAVTNVSTKQASAVKKDKKRILSAVASMPQMERLRLATLNLRTGDLRNLGGLTELQSLDLSKTGLDSGAMPWLENTQLRWFNASHTRVGDRALYDLSRCRQLQHLNLERTSISDQGLKYLYSMPQLRYLNLMRAPVSKTAVEKLSDALPNCLIEWQPLQFLRNGAVNVAAAKNGYTTFGQRLPQDPRVSRRPLPPMDNAPQYLVPNQSGWTIQTGRYQNYNGYILDAF